MNKQDWVIACDPLMALLSAPWGRQAFIFKKMNRTQSHDEYKVNRRGGEVVTAGEIEKCIDDFGADVYRFCLKLCPDKADADDLYQQTFLKALETEKTLDWENNPKALFFSFAYHLWKCDRRKWARRNAIAPGKVSGAAAVILPFRLFHRADRGDHQEAARHCEKPIIQGKEFDEKEIGGGRLWEINISVGNLIGKQIGN